MKRSGVSTEFIQESLGYTSMKTTESYLDSFEKSVKEEYSQKLVAFKDDRSFSGDSLRVDSLRK
jgi:integrase/recombinase XerD